VSAARPTSETFQRARTPAQRAQRRDQILSEATAMLTERAVTEITLNELSRRIGLAKSNVLRYFDSLEAILLTVLTDQWASWLTALEAEIGAGPVSRSATARQRRLCATIARTLGERPTLCDLIAASAPLLERNISTETARDYKHAAIGHTERLAELARLALPELTARAAQRFASYTFVAIAGLWPLAHPSEPVRQASNDTALAGAIVPFESSLEQLLHDVLHGLTR
jgi:AcrR family transcriptional regulator